MILESIPALPGTSPYGLVTINPLCVLPDRTQSRGDAETRRRLIPTLFSNSPCPRDSVSACPRVRTSPLRPDNGTSSQHRIFIILWIALLISTGAQAQDNLDVTFRYIPDPVFAELAFLPGTFNDWGGDYTWGTNCIVAGHESQMTYVRFDDYWYYTTSLEIGETYQYKIQAHTNISGTTCTWLTDPLNPDFTGPYHNSVITVNDPMIFQPAQELSASGLIKAVSAGLFGLETFTVISFSVNGVEQTDGLDFFDGDTGIFRFELDREVRAGAQFRISAVDAAGREVSAEIGELLAPIEWETTPYATLQEQVTIRAFLTRLDGTVDPDLTEATLVINGVTNQTVAVDNGVVEAAVGLEMGENDIRLRAVIDGLAFESDPLVLTRRIHPLERVFVDVSVTGTSSIFIVDLAPTELAPGDVTTAWCFDDVNSTTGTEDLTMGDLQARGTASGAGELYFDVTVTRDDGEEEFRRIAVVIEEDGSVHQMRYEENAAWIRNAVVYEIFPLSFGPEASGSPSSPGRRFHEITGELDFLAQMGFNAIWFMPIMDNQYMDQLSGGYNIVDFYNVDPKLGTNDDFKVLVDRAHELGIKILLDLTPNHVSPQHPWVNSLRNGGPLAVYIQTTPSAHNRGLDSRGANLTEIWQQEGGTNLYRKYDGFGDLANLDWDNDDLQAEMLDVIAYWVREFDIDGWRFDVYWGPWRRYGPDRFGRPVRELMKRIKPDAWLLGEIAGTGFNTEVYYADDDFGTRVVGGLDAAYDWNFYWNAIRGTYGNISNYDNWARNGNFWPGPNARFFRFLENHDEERIAKRYRSTPERILPLTGLLLTTTGVPMIYQGQEVNFGRVSGDERRVSVTWDTERNGQFARYYQRLAQARSQYKAFGTQDLLTINMTNSVYGFVRPLQDKNAVVLVNFNSQARTVTINPGPLVEMTTDGPVPYFDIFADTSRTYLGGFTVTVPPYETVVYITSDDPGFFLPDLPSLPFGAVYTGIDERNEKPYAVRLDQNYPNPFNPVTTITYAISQAVQVHLEVFDVLGRSVAVLINGLQPPGEHAVFFNAKHLPSGTYLYRLQAGRWIEVRSMVLFK